MNSNDSSRNGPGSPADEAPGAETDTMGSSMTKDESRPPEQPPDPVTDEASIPPMGADEIPEGSSETPDGDRKRAILEALLYVSDIPLSADRMAEVIKGCEKKEIRKLLQELNDDYRESGRAFEVVEVAQGYQVRTRGEFSKWIAKLKQQRPQRLTRASMESLAIIAYRQPVTRAEIESIRGVDSGAVLGSLLEKRLIRILGRKEVPGRPILYGTTQDFLELFGLKNLSSLPTLREIEGMFEQVPEEEPEKQEGTEESEPEALVEGEAETAETGLMDEVSGADPAPGVGTDKGDLPEEEESEQEDEDWDDEEDVLEAGELDDILRSTKTKFVSFEQEMSEGEEAQGVEEAEGKGGEGIQPEGPQGTEGEPETEKAGGLKYEIEEEKETGDPEEEKDGK